MADARVSQLVVETISKPAAAARTTQLVAETLAHPLPAARVTHLVIETISHADTPAVTQLVVEALIKTPPTALRVTQSPVELAEQTDAPATPARVSQAALELTTQHAPITTPVRVSQSPLEVARQRTGTPVRVTQAALEIIYPFGCYVAGEGPCTAGGFPIDDAGAGSACEADRLRELEPPLSLTRGSLAPPLPPTDTVSEGLMCDTVLHESLPAVNRLSMPADATGMGADWEAFLCVECTSRVADRFARLDPPVLVVVEPL